MSWYCYLLLCSDGSYYTGVSKDPYARLTVHLRGRGARYTRARLPVRLVYYEEQPDRSAAQRREAVLRKLDHLSKTAITQEFHDQRSASSST